MSLGLYLGCWALIGLVLLVAAYRSEARDRTEKSKDRLAGTVEMWLADERPAWETVAAFERDVERVMSGEMTTDYVDRMPLRTRKIKAADGHTVKVRQPGIKSKCRHRWTTIPASTVDAFARLRGGKVILPDMYAGPVTDPWCVKCRQRKFGGPVRDVDWSAGTRAKLTRITPAEERDIDRIVRAVREGRR